MKKIVVYQKGTCSTCRKAINRLKDLRITISIVDYLDVPFTEMDIRRILKKMRADPPSILRRKEPKVKELMKVYPSISDDQWINFMTEYPCIVERPIIETESKAFLARPAETLEGFLLNEGLL